MWRFSESYTVIGVRKACDHANRVPNIELTFYIPLDTKLVISECRSLDLVLRKLNLTQQKEMFSSNAKIKCKKRKPCLLAFITPAWKWSRPCASDSTLMLGLHVRVINFRIIIIIRAREPTRANHTKFRTN